MTRWFNGRNNDEQVARLEQMVKALGDRVAEIGHQISKTGVHDGQRDEHLVKLITDTGSGTSRVLGRVLRSVKVLRESDRAVTRDVGRLLRRLAQIASAFDVTTDDAFIDAARPIVTSKRTLLGYDRLYVLWQAVINAAPLKLPAVEVGTFRGGSAALLAQALQKFAGPDAELHVVDTFEGHLDETLSEHDPPLQRGQFRRNSYEDVREFLTPFGVHVHKGDASLVIPTWPERRYSLVHLDVDLYRPTLSCLEYFGPRMADAGIIVMDDFEAPSCPGIALAVQQYRAAHPIFQLWKMRGEQAVLVKRTVTRD